MTREKELADERKQGSSVFKMLELAKRYFASTGERNATGEELAAFEAEERAWKENPSEASEMASERKRKKRLANISKELELQVYFRDLKKKALGVK